MLAESGPSPAKSGRNVQTWQNLAPHTGRSRSTSVEVGPNLRQFGTNSTDIGRIGRLQVLRHRSRRVCMSRDSGMRRRPPGAQAIFDQNGGSVPLPVMTNDKTVDPRDKKSTKVCVCVGGGRSVLAYSAMRGLSGGCQVCPGGQLVMNPIESRPAWRWNWGQRLERGLPDMLAAFGSAWILTKIVATADVRQILRSVRPSLSERPDLWAPRVYLLPSLPPPPPP